VPKVEGAAAPSAPPVPTPMRPSLQKHFIQYDTRQ